MKRTRILIAVGLFSALAAYAQEDTTSATPSASPAFTDDKDKISYSVGADIGQTLKKLQLELNQNVLIQGLSDVLSDRPTAMTDQELQQTLQAFQQNMMQKQQAELTKKQAEMKVTAEKNKEAGKEFLAKKVKESGVKKTESGLQYQVLKEGKGDKPKDSDVVQIKYSGTTIDGKEFDSSAKNNSGGPNSPESDKPVSLPVNGVIKGWGEALKLMPVGSKWKLYVPSELAYGDEGAGDDIAPGSTLVFNVELVSIEKGSGSNPPGINQKKLDASSQKKGSN